MMKEFSEVDDKVLEVLVKTTCVNEVSYGNTSYDDNELCVEVTFRDDKDVQYEIEFMHICEELYADVVYATKGSEEALKEVRDYVNSYSKDILEDRRIERKWEEEKEKREGKK